MEGSIEAAPNDIKNPYIVLETSMMEELDCLSPMSNSHCIYRVSDRLRRVCEEAYTPRVISIGPLHHGKKSLEAMEEHKMRYLKYFLCRTNLSLKDYIKMIKDQEVRLRSCYVETIRLESDAFVRVILVDVIFVIEFLFRYWYPGKFENDCIFGRPKMIEDVWPDLLMLENQLSFFILEYLFDPLIFHVPSHYSNRLYGFERLSIMFLSLNFLENKAINTRGMVKDMETICCSEVQVEHFVHILRILCIAPIPKPQAAKQPTAVTAPTIEELHRAGVKLKVGSIENLFDLQFKDGILKIPKLEMVDTTELILRNLVAFEQSLCQEIYISEYLTIIDQLVDTAKDVELLVEYGIVENRLGGGNNALSTMINSLSTEIGIYRENFYYGTLCEDLNKFYSSTWHKRKANLRQNYFNTPWATISFSAAVLLLILTVIQTICSIIALA